jgi:RAS guanyl-releasing protein 1
MAVMGGICHSTIVRLSKTILYVSNEDQRIINEYNDLLSSNCNYGQYRKTTNEIHNFWIPIM